MNPCLHYRVHRTGFLTEAAVDAFEEVDVVPRGAPHPVQAYLRVDGNGQCRADCLT